MRRNARTCSHLTLPLPAYSDICATATLRQTEDVPNHLLAHLSPLGWEHVNLTGDYVWGAQSSVAENTDGLRALRSPPEAYPRAA